MGSSHSIIWFPPFFSVYGKNFFQQFHEIRPPPLVCGTRAVGVSSFHFERVFGLVYKARREESRRSRVSIRPKKGLWGLESGQEREDGLIKRGGGGFRGINGVSSFSSSSRLKREEEEEKEKDQNIISPSFGEETFNNEIQLFETVSLFPSHKINIAHSLWNSSSFSFPHVSFSAPPPSG